MATIDDLPNPNFSTMSDEELENLIRATRNRRANPPVALRQKAQKIAIERKKKREVKEKDERRILADLKALSPKDREAFLKEIQGE